MRWIDIRKTNEAEKFHVYLMRDGSETPVTRDAQKVDFDRRAVALKCRKDYQAPTAPVGHFTKAEAIHVAHRIGNYCFGLGDLVFGYTFVDGLRNEDFFNE